MGIIKSTVRVGEKPPKEVIKRLRLSVTNYGAVLPEAPEIAPYSRHSGLIPRSPGLFGVGIRPGPFRALYGAGRGMCGIRAPLRLLFGIEGRRLASGAARQGCPPPSMLRLQAAGLRKQSRPASPCR
jgi:hypothetical protein